MGGEVDISEFGELEHLQELALVGIIATYKGDVERKSQRNITMLDRGL